MYFTTRFLFIHPWFEGSKHPYTVRWKEDHDRTPWSERLLRTLKEQGGKGIEKKIYTGSFPVDWLCG